MIQFGICKNMSLLHLEEFEKSTSKMNDFQGGKSKCFPVNEYGVEMEN